MSILIPRKGIFKWLNPAPFNSKEHAAIIIMSSSAATCALATEILAAQKLYYPTSPSGGTAIFMLFSSQLIGYGFAGLNRGGLVNKRKLVYPVNLPMNTLIETFHRDKNETRQRLRFFWIVSCSFKPSSILADHCYSRSLLVSSAGRSCPNTSCQYVCYLNSNQEYYLTYT